MFLKTCKKEFKLVQYCLKFYFQNLVISSFFFQLLFWSQLKNLPKRKKERKLEKEMWGKGGKFEQKVRNISARHVKKRRERKRENSIYIKKMSKKVIIVEEKMSAQFSFPAVIQLSHSNLVTLSSYVFLPPSTRGVNATI